MDTKPAGSLEPTNAGKGKWWNGVDAVGLSELDALATDINKAVDTTIKQVARGKIKVGKLLLEARQLFVDDQGFGKWRKEKTMVQSKQHAHYLMQVAERFGDAPKLIDGANYSVMQELVLADQKDIEWVEDRIEAGEPPTVQEVRTKVKETQAERLAPKGTSKKGKVIAPSTIMSPNAPLNLIVQMGLTNRIKQVAKDEVKGVEGDLIILGLDPDPQTPCHPDNLELIMEYWAGAAEDNDEAKVVLDSYRRVKEEFKRWHSQ